MQHISISYILLLVAVLLSACATPAPATPAATNTPPPIATATPIPSEVPEDTTENAWDYVALGDSNPGGYGVSRSYADIFADYMAADLGVEVRLHNHAFNGAKSAQLLEQLQTDIELQQDLRDAEVVTIDIGANDWTTVAHAYPSQACGGKDNQDCLRALIQSYSENLDAILNEIDTLQGEDSKGLIRTVDLYMSNCDFSRIYGDAELFKNIKPYLDEFNALVEQTTQTHHGEVVRLYLTFNGPDGTQNPVSYLQSDQCHLNPDGHLKVADMLRELGYEK